MIFHLVEPRAWEQAMERGFLAPRSLREEGFVHCSTEDQILESASKHFEGQDELIVLEIPPKRVKEILRWEPARGGELFPHLYGKISLDMVENTRMIFRLPDGNWEWD
ncbi:MAG: DUF952 domain-containing protein [Bacteroidetes bacterium]|nr:MAG: DUF952 domain-containing protein [Bacteroidota bacterium]